MSSARGDLAPHSHWDTWVLPSYDAAIYNFWPSRLQEGKDKRILQERLLIARTRNGVQHLHPHSTSQSAVTWDYLAPRLWEMRSSHGTGKKRTIRMSASASYPQVWISIDVSLQGGLQWQAKLHHLPSTKQYYFFSVTQMKI